MDLDRITRKYIMYLKAMEIGNKLTKLKNKFKKIKPEIWLILILIFALALRLVFFTGLNTSDDFAYVNDVYRIIKPDGIFGEYRPCSWLMSCRVMLLYPMTLYFALFGISNFTAALYQLLCSLGGIVLIFYIGKILFNLISSQF